LNYEDLAKNQKVFKQIYSELSSVYLSFDVINKQFNEIFKYDSYRILGQKEDMILKKNNYLNDLFTTYESIAIQSNKNCLSIFGMQFYQNMFDELVKKLYNN
jgi:hypothetical protein